MKPKFLIVLMGHDPFHLGAVEQIALQVSNFATPVILDTTYVSTTPVTSYSANLLKLFRIKYPAINVKHFFESNSIEFLRIQDLKVTSAPMPASILSEVKVATDSALITYYRHHDPYSLGKKVKKTASKLINESAKIYDAIICFASPNLNIKYGAIPNGRFPNQKAAQLAFETLNIELWHYERGEPPKGIYFQNYAPQARTRSQEAALEITSTNSDEEIRLTGENWIKARSQPGSSTNEFAYLWNSSKAKLGDSEKSSKKLAGFFSSSQDEFLHLGPDWQRHGWVSQVDAFDKVMTKLESLNYEIVLRIHPNLATKAHSYFKFEVSEFEWLKNRHPNLKIFWHDEPLNTYELLKQLNVCIVWDSTVGMEASALGIPTWALATTRYGLVADVRELLDEKNIPPSEFEWEVNKQGAFKFINYLLQRDIQLGVDIQKWSTWDMNDEPWQVQLSKVFASGGNVNFLESLTSILDTYRNRSLKSNIIVIKRKLNSLLGKK